MMAREKMSSTEPWNYLKLLKNYIPTYVREESCEIIDTVHAILQQSSTVTLTVALTPPAPSSLPASTAS